MPNSKRLRWQANEQRYENNDNAGYAVGTFRESGAKGQVPPSDMAGHSPQVDSASELLAGRFDDNLVIGSKNNLERSAAESLTEISSGCILFADFRRRKRDKLRRHSYYNRRMSRHSGPRNSALTFCRNSRTVLAVVKLSLLQTWYNIGRATKTDRALSGRTPML
jgi:hypothetical protein